MTHRGYHTERAVCRYLGIQRIGGVGRRDGGEFWLAVEVKQRNLPKWLTEAMEQSERLARPDQLPIVVFHQKGDRYDDDLVVLRLKEFRDWFGEAEKRKWG